MQNKIRILYIDDYELDRELVKDALEKEHGGSKSQRPLTERNLRFY